MEWRWKYWRKRKLQRKYFPLSAVCLFFPRFFVSQIQMIFYRSSEIFSLKKKPAFFLIQKTCGQKKGLVVFITEGGRKWKCLSYKTKLWYTFIQLETLAKRECTQNEVECGFRGWAKLQVYGQKFCSFVEVKTTERVFGSSGVYKSLSDWNFTWMRSLWFANGPTQQVSKVKRILFEFFILYFSLWMRGKKG